MDITPHVPQSACVINGYNSQGFVINQQQVDGSIVITENRYRPLELESLSALTPVYIQEIMDSLKSDIEILIIGTGKRSEALSKELLKVLDIPFEVMTTHAACRTYNILMAEGRLVAAVLLVE